RSGDRGCNPRRPLRPRLVGRHFDPARQACGQTQTTPLTLAQRAPVGSTEASASLLARFGVVGPKRANEALKAPVRRSRPPTSLSNLDPGCAMGDHFPIFLVSSTSVVISFCDTTCSMLLSHEQAIHPRWTAADSDSARRRNHSFGEAKVSVR